MYMTRKNILIALGVVARRRRRRRRESLVRRETGADGHDRGDQDARPRGDRVGVGQDPAEAARQHQRRHAGPRRRSRRQRRRSRHEGAVPAADRPEVAAHARRQRHGVARRRRKASLEQLRQTVETARVQLDQAQTEPGAPAGSLEAAAHDARGARKGGERRAGRRVGAAGAREAGRRAGGADRPGARRPRERPLRSEQGPHRVADRRHRHAPQHPGRRDRGDRHDEQRRHGAADARRHVGHPGRSRGRRDQHPERVSSASRRRSRSTRCPTGPSRATSPRSATARFRRRRRRPQHAQATNFKVVVMLDEHDPDVRPGFTCTADITTATRKQRRRRCRFRRWPSASWSTTPTARSCKEPTRPTSGAGAAVEPVAVGGGAQARADPQGNRGRVRRPRRQRVEFVPIKMGIAGDKYFEVLDGLKPGDEVDHRARTTRSAAWPTATR